MNVHRNKQNNNKFWWGRASECTYTECLGWWGNNRISNFLQTNKQLKHDGKYLYLIREGDYTLYYGAYTHLYAHCSSCYTSTAPQYRTTGGGHTDRNYTKDSAKLLSEHGMERSKEDIDFHLTTIPLRVE